MLSRAASNSKLRRSKSSTSVKSRRQKHHTSVEPLDPQAARLHALTAASLAMQRHRLTQRSSIDSGLSFGRSYGSETNSTMHPRRGHSAQSSDGGYSLPSNHRAGSRSPTPLKTMPLKEGSLEPVPELPANAAEFGFLDDVNVPSVPSSYKRLRKSKSMFSASQRSVPPPPRTDNRNSAAHGVGLSRTTLRRSLSFFKGKGGTTYDEDAGTSSSNAAVQLARDQFLQTSEKQSMSNISPSANSNRRSQEHRPFRKSFRPTNTDDIPITPDPTEERQHGSKTSFFSLSIKKGFRRLFGRSSESRDLKYSTQISLSPPPSTVTESAGSSADTVTDPGRPPPLPSHAYGAAGQVERLASSAHRPASLRTVQSSGGMSTVSSRVSSWTESTAGNTIKPGHGEMEYNQLGVIRENSGSQQSGYAPTIQSHHDGYSVFRQPLHSTHGEKCAGEVYDSQRVYSALMRRIDRSNKENIKDDDDATPRPAKTKTSRLEQDGTVRTIKQIPSSASIQQSVPSPGMRRQSSLQRRGSPRKPRGPTPQQVVRYNEKEGYQTQVSPYSSRSTVAPHQPRAPTHRNQVSPQLDSREMSPENGSGTVIVSRPDLNRNMLQSPSVYSRTTSGCSLRDPNQSDSSDDERGTVTILTSHRVPYSPTRQGGDRNSNKVGKGSADWKQWMSSQLDIINTAPMNTSFSNTHYRENAQINDDGFQLQTCTGGKPDDPASEKEEWEQTRQPLAEVTPLSSNNFSRPLRRTPSGPISIRSTSVQRPSIVTTDHSPSSATVIASTDTLTGPSNGSPRTRTTSKGSKRSSLTQGRIVQSESPQAYPSPTQDGHHRNSPSGLRSLHGVGATSFYGPEEPKRHSPATPTRPNQGHIASTKENQRLYDGNTVRRKNAEDRLAKLEGPHSTIKSKRMVDIFLSDRRRLMGSEDDNDDMTAPEPAFL